MSSKIRNGKLNDGDRVEIYRNLHNGCMSIRRDGKVVKHLQKWQSLFLEDVKFAVQPAGREKVRREGKKNVHAFVRGTVIAPSTMNHTTDVFKEKCKVWVTYNPYQNDTFVANVPDPETTFTTFQSVLKANLVAITQGYLYASL
jgi:hypothetical protein